MNNEHDYIDVTDELAEQNERREEAERLEKLLEKEAAESPAAKAGQELAEFDLSDLAKDILARAIENASRNTGNGIVDQQAKDKIRSTAELLQACDLDLGKTLLVLGESVPVTELPNLVYSTCFSVMKAVAFLGNLMYRKALDPKDGEGRPVADHRDDREAPYGLGPDGEDGITMYAQILQAVDDLRLYLQLLTEMYGWDPLNPMPFAYMQEKDGTFTPIHGVEQAFDYLEIRRKEAQAKRQERQAAAISTAAANAKDILLRIAARK